MKLFKNGVGRPSNETKELRQVFIVSVVAIIISVVTLLVCLFNNSNVLTQNLMGATSYKISYGLANANSGDISSITYPKTSTHSGRVSFSGRPTYTVKNGKTCSFKGWILQRNSDGRYRVYNKGTGKDAWYHSSKDKKISWSYVYFTTGSLSVDSAVKLYAAFDCKSTNSNTTTTTKKASTSISMPKYHSGDGTRHAELILGKSYGKFSVTTSKSGLTVNVKSSDSNLVKVVKHGANSWELKVTSDLSKRGNSVMITATTSDGASLTYEYFLRTKYKTAYVTEAKTHGTDSDVYSHENLDFKLSEWDFVRAGYTFKGWYAYRNINGIKKYFQYSTSNKGWNCSSTSCAKKFSNKANVSILQSYTKEGANVYFEAVWSKKSSKEFHVTYCEKVNDCYNDMPCHIIDTNDKLKANKLTKSGKKFDGWYPYRKVSGSIKYLKYNSSKGTCEWQSSKSTVIKDKEKLGKYIKNCTGTGVDIYLEAKWK